MNKKTLLYLFKTKFFFIAFSIGSTTWLICPIISNQTEPFDTSMGFYTGQVIMSIFTFYVGWKHDFLQITLSVVGIYLGQLFYSSLIINDPMWAIGVLTILFLCAFPTIAGLLALLLSKIKLLSS